ncbi:MAG: hypothetical protein IAE77_00770 [Prosthecobacter sp.]|jgi:endonuclease YncB( thermonuclease family)|uniref:hypothetical protein n=1 Tax=Prosthecobacter sp. TaxID=1965333 RepID=UPI0019DBE445|nr:hypothetical protein [Prosthecobacter sp.]MBE2281971.1 hypothetical protein [Prosthecobacter sp.]
MSRNNRHRPGLCNRGGVPFLILKGHFIVRQNQMPDGDTLAFAAARDFDAGPVKTNVPVDDSGDTSVNIRLQSIDAPEKTQPLGASCRDALLTQFDFDPQALGLSNTDFKANGGPHLKEGWLATHGMDGNRRPLGYLFAKDPGFNHGEIVSAADVGTILDRSANYEQAAKGWSYPAFYENTDESHAAQFQAVSERARDEQLGVWEHDATTTGFIPTKAETDKDGSLVYPKFYRRIMDWPRQTADAGAFIQWLRQQNDGRKLVAGAQASPVPLWELFEELDDQTVVVPYDVTRLWFSE